MVQVTRATTDDAAEIAAVKSTGWRTTYSAWVPDAVLAPFLDVRAQTDAIVAELAQPPNFAVIARDDARLLGFATCLLAGRSEPLLDRLARELEPRTTLVVKVVEENVRTRRLYERLGAAYVGTAPAGWAPEFVREAEYRWDDLAGLRVGQEYRRS